MEITNDQWITKALEAHSILSLKIARQFVHVSEHDAQRKADLKKALNLIDQLDFLLESFPAQQALYTKTYRYLFSLLETLGLRRFAKDALQRRFGPDCFFVRQAAHVSTA